MKMEKKCDKCQKPFKCNSYNHRTKCYECLPKATHKYYKPVNNKKVEKDEKNKI